MLVSPVNWERSTMSYRNILVQVDETPSAAARVAAAADVASRFGASLTGMFLRSQQIPAFIVGDAFTAVVTVEMFIEERDRKTAAARAEARAVFEAAVAGGSPAPYWIEVDGDDDRAVLAAARRFDLTIFPHLATSSFGTHAISATTVGMDSGAPVLILPERGYATSFGKKVLVAWKETRESARAVRDAMPFLKGASEVHFLCVSRDAPPDFDDTQRRHLALHGCQNIHMHVDRNDDQPVANAIQRHAGMVGADLVVLGLYGHSRMRELVLGGVSRDMLASLDLPLLVSH
jgi:nucleotide-binding universal stress UspA family protein